MEKIFIYFEVLITGMYFKTLIDANIILYTYILYIYIYTYKNFGLKNWKIKKYGYVLLYYGYYKT